MGNKYSQTQEAKEKFVSPLLTYMLAVKEADPGHTFTKDELIKVFQKSDRFIRHEIERIANYYPIVATSDKKGYRLLTFDENSEIEVLVGIREEYEHQLSELMSRVNSLYARMKPLIAARSEIDKVITNKTPFDSVE